MIRSGEKKEEYRKLSKYYKSLFMDFSTICGDCTDFVGMIYAASHPEEDKFFKKFDKVVFFEGYPSKNDTERRIEFYNPRINIGKGKKKWGAIAGEYYFVITWEGAAK